MRAALGLPVVLDERSVDRLGRVAPLLGQRRELLEVVRDRAPPARLVDRVELVVRLDALHVRPEHPVAVDALVVDEQAARLRLVEQRDRVELVADRLVDEPLAAHVDQHAVLGVDKLIGANMQGSDTFTPDAMRWP